MIGFSYLCLLLFIIIFILYLFKKNTQLSPVKIKVFFAMAFAPLILKFLVLMCGVIIEKQSIIYLLKPFVFLNFFSVPLLVMGCLFIFLRDEKFNFHTNNIFLIILLVLYCLFAIFYKIDINISTTFGFILNIKEMIMPVLVYLIIISGLAVCTFLFIDKPYSNKFGMRILLVSLIVFIVEYIFYLGGIKIFPYPLIGEIFILFSTFKAIETFK